MKTDIKLLECNDDEILKAVKGLAQNIANETLLQPAGIVSWAMVAVQFAAEINGDKTSFSIGDLHNKETGKHYGNWKCTLEKLDEIKNETDDFPKIIKMSNDTIGNKDIFGITMKFDKNTSEMDIIKIIQDAVDKTGIEPLRFAIYGEENEASIWAKGELVIELIKYKKE